MFRRIRVAVVAISTALVTVLGAAPAHAAGPWFVSTTGNNANGCLSAANACATIQGVLAKAGMVNGDTINVAAGTYTGTTTFSTKGANVVGPASGSPATLDGNNAASVIVMNGNVAVKLTNLTVSRGFSNGTVGAGVRVGAGALTAQNVNIINNKGNYGAGVGVANAATFTMR